MIFIPSLCRSLFDRSFPRQNCRFNSKTAVRVAYAGLFGFSVSGECCSRWFFIYNGKECGEPMAIEGIMYGASTSNYPARHKQTEDENISAGEVLVGILQ